MKQKYWKYSSFAFVAIAMLLFALSPSVALASSGADGNNEGATNSDNSLVAESSVLGRTDGFVSTEETQDDELSNPANDENANSESDLSQDDSPEQEIGGDNQDAEGGGVLEPGGDIGDIAPVGDSGCEDGSSDDVTLDNPGQSSVKPYGMGDFDDLPVMSDGDSDESSKSETVSEAGNGQVENRESQNSTTEATKGNEDNGGSEKDRQSEQPRKVGRQKKTGNAADEAACWSSVIVQAENSGEVDSKVSIEALGSQESDDHEVGISRVSVGCGMPEAVVGASSHDVFNNADPENTASRVVNYGEQCYVKHEAMRNSGSRHSIPFDIFLIHFLDLNWCGLSFLPETQLTAIVRACSFGQKSPGAILYEAANGSTDNQYSFVGCEHNGRDARGFKRAHRCRSP